MTNTKHPLCVEAEAYFFTRELPNKERIDSLINIFEDYLSQELNSKPHVVGIKASFKCLRQINQLAMCIDKVIYDPSCEITAEEDLTIDLMIDTILKEFPSVVLATIVQVRYEKNVLCVKRTLEGRWTLTQECDVMKLTINKLITIVGAEPLEQAINWLVLAMQYHLQDQSDALIKHGEEGIHMFSSIEDTFSDWDLENNQQYDYFSEFHCLLVNEAKTRLIAMDPNIDQDWKAQIEAFDSVSNLSHLLGTAASY